jgi:hypothetical protein
MLSKLSLGMSNVFIKDKIKIPPPEDLLSNYVDDKNLNANMWLVIQQCRQLKNKNVVE